MADPSIARDAVLNEQGISDQPVAFDPPPDLAAHAPAASAPTSTRRSRRTLLKLGGAAAGVAATAAVMASEGLGTPVARADTGNTFVSGGFNTAGDNTFLVPGGPTLSGLDSMLVVDASSRGGIHGVVTFTTNATGVGGNDKGNGTGVSGTSNTGIGVLGVSGGFGVVGQSQGAAAGVQGTSAGGVGVWGHTSNGIPAVVGDGDWWVGGSFRGAAAQIGLQPNPGIGAPSSGQHLAGMLYVDSASTLWFCTTSGTPGTWIRLSGPQSGTRGGAITYLSTPVRLLDARTSASSGLVNRDALAGNEVYTFAVAGLGGIPANAQGLIGNVTVLGPSGAGNLSLYPAGAPTPTVASMTFGQPGLFQANGVNVAIGSGGAINIQNQSGGTTPLVLDAVAYVS
jgi:hypothetical protein